MNKLLSDNESIAEEIKIVMSHIRNIDKEEYAKKALELFEQDRESYVKFAYEQLKDGASPEYARSRLGREVENNLEQLLFNYLKRTGIVQGSVRHDYSYGYCRLKLAEPKMDDVPSELLNISEVLMMYETLPKFADVIDSVMMDARKLIMVDAIESTTKEAK